MSNASIPAIPCDPAAFQSPTLFGNAILSIDAAPVYNYTASSPPFSNPNYDTVPPVTLDFCNVTVTHTHLGQQDVIQTQIWLPSRIWNGRMQGIGGGGFIAGLWGYMFIAMDAAIAEGYAAVSTNAGLNTNDINGGDADLWALLSPGNVNLNALRNFADVSLRDMSVFGKQIIENYYGVGPQYSYWSGCSNGGRQGYVLAQKYPELYDGIAACAPGIFWDESVENYWAQQLMNERKQYPRPCEFDGLQEAMLQACDGLDGIVDGILTVPEDCTFDPRNVLGKTVQCAEVGGNITFSETAVEIAEGIWKDKRPAGIDFQGRGAGYDVDLKYLAGTECSSNGSSVGDPPPLTLNLLKIFVKKDTSWDPLNMTRREFEDLRRQSVREYRSIIGISDYDMSGFRNAGAKMITYQGTSDPAVSYKNTLRFYDGVAAEDPSVHEYYRVFLAPGLGHAVGGRGAYPHTTFRALVDWVEKGKAPDQLQATSAPINGTAINRILCPYPKRSKYDGHGDTNKFESYACV